MRLSRFENKFSINSLISFWYSSNYAEIESVKPRHSIRSKLLYLLVSLPVASLGVYLVMASSVFVRDKIAYVFDSTAQNSAVLANQVKTSMASFQNILKPIISVTELKERRFGSEALNRFQGQKTIEHLYLMRYDGIKMLQLDKIVLFPRELKDTRLTQKITDQLLKIIKTSDVALLELAEKSRFYWYMQKIKSEEPGVEDSYILAAFKMPDLFEAFATPGIYSSYLVTRSGEITMSPKFWRNSQIADKIVDVEVFNRALSNPSPQGVFDTQFKSGKDVLISYAVTKVGDYLAVSVVDKTLALEAFRKLLIRTALFFVAVISTVFMVAMIASNHVTRALSQLVDMTTEIANGNFMFAKKIDSNDEIGTLADNVVWMAKEVDRLFAARDVQARMEAELEMVTTIQENLFPARRKRMGNFQIESYFESATEAGGDWFHYSMMNDRLYLWIGDATGHGAPAALITAAAKATSACIEGIPNMDLTPSSMLKTMNYAIHETSKGSVLMTFFLASIDTHTGEGIYCNASHEIPFIYPRKSGLKKGDLSFLCDDPGPRLGQSPDSEYEESKFKMEPGDTIILFTDGVADLQNPQGKALGERKFLGTVIKGADNGGSVDKVIRNLRDNIVEYRGSASLVDDLMIIVCQYDPV